MSTTDTVIGAFMLIALSIIPLFGMVITMDRRPVFAWFCEGLFVVMAGSGIVWLMLCFYVAVLL